MMLGFPYVDVDYCKYRMPYRTITRLWNNVSGFKPRPLCKKDCNSMTKEKGGVTNTIESAWGEQGGVEKGEMINKIN